MTPVTNWTLELDSLVSFPDSFLCEVLIFMQKSDLDQILDLFFTSFFRLDDWSCCSILYELLFLISSNKSFYNHGFDREF